MNQWIPEERIWDNDCIGDGTTVAGSVYSRRWTSEEPIDGAYGLVTIQTYCEDRWVRAGDENATIEDVFEGERVPKEERYRITFLVEYMRATDPEEPGGTEVWSDVSYKESWFSRAEKFTDEQIKALMENYKTEWIYWDGLSDSMDADVQSMWAEPMEAVDWDERVPVLTEELLAWVFLMETFREELCHECMQGADGHIAKRDMFNNWHAWCRITDPAYALQVLRDRIQRADTTKHENGFSDEDTRAKEFEAAVYALEEAKCLAIPAEQFINYRKWSVADKPEQREFGLRKLREEIEHTAGTIAYKAASQTKEA